MHPLLITPLYAPAVGGAATYMRELIPALLERSEIDQLTVLTEREHGRAEETVEGKLRVLRWLPTRISEPRATWVEHAVTYAWTEAWFAMYLPGVIRRFGIDLLQFHTRYRGRAFRGAIQRCRVPVVASLHDKFGEPRVLATVADRLLCCAEGVRRFALGSGFPAERIVTLPLPFRPQAPPPSAEVSALRQHYKIAELPFVLFVGDITESKGVYDLLDGYRRWQSSGGATCQLVFGGNNWEHARFLAELNRTPGAVYLGRVEDRHIRALVYGAEIVALPSRSEGLPYIMLEALTGGRKVIAPRNIPEFEEPLIGFVPAEPGPAGIAAALQTVWERTDHPVYSITPHEPERVASATVSMYGDLLRNGGRK